MIEMSTEPKEKQRLSHESAVFSLLYRVYQTESGGGAGRAANGKAGRSPLRSLATC